MQFSYPGHCMQQVRPSSEQPPREAHAQPYDSPPDLAAVTALCAADMAKVDEFIRANLDSDVVLIRQIAEYIINSGGKRLRPMLLVLAARACGYQGEHHVTLAAVIEFIHTATLLHDDVVDESQLRRGRQSAHAVWGNAASVLVGDFLYSRSFQMMVRADSMRVMEVLSNATNMIAEGEVEQLLNMHDPDVSEDGYYSVIRKKTARLFEAALRDRSRFGIYGMNRAATTELSARRPVYPEVGQRGLAGFGVCCYGR